MTRIRGSTRGREHPRSGSAALLGPIALTVAFVAGMLYGMLVVETGIFPHDLVRDASVFVKSRVGRATEPAPPGRWFRARGAAGTTRELTEEEESEIMRLVTLGYVSGSVPAPDESGVAVHDRGRAFQGLNLYTSGHAAEAFLLDMDGRVLHTWGKPSADVWPGYEGPVEDAEHQLWRRVHLFDNGDLLAVYDWLGIIKVDRESRLLWSREGRNHHDLDVLDDGTIPGRRGSLTIYVLEGESRIIPWIDPRRPVAEDYIAVLEPDGTLRRRFSLLDAFVRSSYAPILEGMPAWGDIMHTNTLEVLDGRYEDLLPAFREGNLLVSVREMDAVAVVDPEREEVVWAVTGLWRLQHEPALVEPGNLMIFNNQARVGQASEVVEIDPRTQELVWVYPPDPRIPFYSEACGSNARLPNGNTLITESDNGRAIEVTPGGEIVWEFLNPHRAGENRELVATLYEMQRLPPDLPLGWLPAPDTP